MCRASEAQHQEVRCMYLANGRRLSAGLGGLELYLVYLIKIPLHVSGFKIPSSEANVYVCGK
jgi:hypothetical protein